ncbi:hypothetical protein LCGC14_1083300 [marine sediment metagenome]|uniref:Uncharacterized protein n=1 Tax=marine sediment metagenome TaxID=412755 RepID=A0A0F9MES2_9ZZZZ
MLDMLKDLEKEDRSSIGDEIAKDIALVEYYYKVQIKGDYPIMKRFNQQENLMTVFDLDAKRFGLKK